MKQIQNGFTLWARQTLESEIFLNKPDKWFKIWFYLVNKVNHKDNKQFKKGGCFTKYEWIENATGASKNQVKHCIEYLKHATMLATQKATRGMFIIIINYDTYQNIPNYQSHTKRNLKATQKPHRSHTRNKNDNNDKNNNIKESIKEKDTLSFDSGKISFSTKEYPHFINEEFKDIWEAWLDIRKKKRAPNTQFALKITLKKLKAYSIKEAVLMLEQSVERGYTGVFPFKDQIQGVQYGRSKGSVGEDKYKGIGTEIKD